MRLSQNQEMSLAYSIDLENEGIHAPISDIIRAIRDLQRAGVRDDKIEDIVPKMLKQAHQEDGGVRNPRDAEILIYDIESENMREMFINPE